MTFTQLPVFGEQSLDLAGNSRKKTVDDKSERDAVRSARLLAGTQRRGAALGLSPVPPCDHHTRAGQRRGPRAALPARSPNVSRRAERDNARICRVVLLRVGGRDKRVQKLVEGLEDPVLRLVQGTAASLHPPMPQGHEPPPSPTAWEAMAREELLKYFISVADT